MKSEIIIVMRKYSLLIFLFSLCIIYAVKKGDASMVKGMSMASSSYSTDTWTILYDDFENTTKAESFSASAGYGTGYRGGVGLYLSDRTANALFSETIWDTPITELDTDAATVRTGTFEFYYKPDTVMFEVPRFILLSHNADDPLFFASGQMALSVTGGNTLQWDIGRSAGVPASSNYMPPLNPGQWYHIAVTWDTHSGSALFVNGTQVDQDASFVDIDTALFFIGSTSGDSTLPGTFDKFRISSKVRTETELPSALAIVIDTPRGNFQGETWFQPFQAAFMSQASDSPAITVKLLLSSETDGYSGTEIRSGLTQTETVTLSGLTAGKYRLIAIATTGLETAYATTDFLAIQTDTSSPFASVTQSDAPKACLLSKIGLGYQWVRDIRDYLLMSKIGRMVCRWNY